MGTGPRSDILHLAETYVNGDRNAQYGDPSADFQRTATFWNTYLSGVMERKISEWYAAGGGELTVADVKAIMASIIDTWDVAWMMNLLKASRSTVSPFKGDHYADAAGYTACGYDTTIAAGNPNWAADELLVFRTKNMEEVADIMQSNDARSVLAQRVRERSAQQTPSVGSIDATPQEIGQWPTTGTPPSQ